MIISSVYKFSGQGYPHQLAAYLTDMKSMGPVNRIISDHSTAVKTALSVHNRVLNKCTADTQYSFQISTS